MITTRSGSSTPNTRRALSFRSSRTAFSSTPMSIHDSRLPMPMVAQKPRIEAGV